MSTERELRERVVAAGKRLIEKNLVQGTWGNISVRLDDKYMLVTPTGMDYLTMKESDLVKVEISTCEYDKSGNKPTSEKGIHAGILLSRPEINAVIHSHPSYSCSVAVTGKELPMAGDETLTKGNCRVAKYALPSTEGLVNNVLMAMENRNGCFMANHGVIACGETLDIAFDTISAMENNAYENIKAAVERDSGERYSLDVMFRLFERKINK